MNLIYNGGPAFPVPMIESETHGIQSSMAYGEYGGMTLRDWFAGQALAGLCANPSIHQPNPMSGWSLANCSVQNLSEYATHIADAMIAAREKGAQ